MAKHLVYRTKWISIHKYKKGTVDCQLFNNGKTSFKTCFKTEIFLERLYIHIYWKSKYSIKQFTIENLSSLYIYTLYFVQRIRSFFKIKKIRWLVRRKEFFIEEETLLMNFLQRRKTITARFKRESIPKHAWEFISSGDLNAIRYRFVRKSHLLANCCILSRRRRGTL